jgi:stage V sporulation protein SpoVS
MTVFYMIVIIHYVHATVVAGHTINQMVLMLHLGMLHGVIALTYPPVCVVLFMQAPQTLIRAQSSGSNHAYRAVTTIAAAQDGLQQPGKVLLYVPFTKSSAFTAIVLPASDTVEQVSPNTPTLTVAESTNAKELANKLSYGLIKQGGAVLLSAGAAAAAKTVQALLIVRQQLLGRGYEVGVLPRFQLGRRTDDPVRKGAAAHLNFASAGRWANVSVVAAGRLKLLGCVGQGSQSSSHHSVW